MSTVPFHSHNGSAIEELLNREAIRDCLFRYCHAVDRCDVEMLRSVYWPGAIDEHVFVRRTAEEYIDWAMPILQSRDQTVHSIGNILIRMEGSTAHVESYFHAYERIRRKDGTRNDFTTSGRYIDRMEGRSGQWRIAERIVVLDCYRVWSDSADWSRGLFGQQVELGKRGAEDRSHAYFCGSAPFEVK
jgi:SnoaL-like domain